MNKSWLFLVTLGLLGYSDSVLSSHKYQEGDSWMGTKVHKSTQKIPHETIRYRFGGEGIEPYCPFIVAGLHDIEPGHRWTEEEVLFLIPVVHPFGRVVGFTLPDVTALRSKWTSQRLKVSGNGTLEKEEGHKTLVKTEGYDISDEYCFDRWNESHSITVRFSDDIEIGMGFVRFNLPNACKPGEKVDRTNADPRVLGLALKYMDIHFIRYPEERVGKLEYRLAGQGEQSPACFDITGFSGPEPTHRWTEEPEATINIPIHLDEEKRVSRISLLNTRAFISPDYAQTLRVHLNHLNKAFVYNMQTSSHTIDIPVPDDVISAAKIILDLPNACLASTLDPNNGDPRKLGLWANLIELSTVTTNLRPVVTRRYRLADEGDAAPFLFDMSGFSGAEPTHRWTNGNQAKIKIPSTYGGERVVGIRFLNTWGLIAQNYPQKLFVRIKNVVMEYNYTSNTSSHTLEVLLPKVRDEFEEVSFDMPNACPPGVIFPGSEDPRNLAILFNIVELISQKEGIPLPVSVKTRADAQEKVERFKQAKLVEDEKRRVEALKNKKDQFIESQIQELFYALDDERLLNKARCLLGDLNDRFEGLLGMYQIMVKTKEGSIDDVLKEIRRSDVVQRLEVLQQWLDDNKKWLDHIERLDGPAKELQARFIQIPGAELMLSGNPDGYPHNLVGFGHRFSNKARNLLDQESGPQFEILESGDHLEVLIKAQVFPRSALQSEVIRCWQPGNLYNSKETCEELFSDRLVGCKFFVFQDYLWGVHRNQGLKLRILYKTGGFQLCGEIMKYLLESYKVIHYQDEEA